LILAYEKKPQSSSPSDQHKLAAANTNLGNINDRLKEIMARLSAFEERFEFLLDGSANSPSKTDGDVSEIGILNHLARTDGLLYQIEGIVTRIEQNI
jgi:hypothetical protein